MTDADTLEAIEKRVRATICDTYGSKGHSVEGRISEADFNELLRLIGDIRKDERERCARLHEQINPACDHELANGDPGAGAMGAVIAYRDQIRSLQ